MGMHAGPVDQVRAGERGAGVLAWRVRRRKERANEASASKEGTGYDPNFPREWGAKGARHQKGKPYVKRAAEEEWAGSAITISGPIQEGPRVHPREPDPEQVSDRGRHRHQRLNHRSCPS